LLSDGDGKVLIWTAEMFLWDVALVDKFFWAIVALALILTVEFEVALAEAFTLAFTVTFFWARVALALELTVVLAVLLAVTLEV